MSRSSRTDVWWQAARAWQQLPLLCADCANLRTLFRRDGRRPASRAPGRQRAAAGRHVSRHSGADSCRRRAKRSSRASRHFERRAFPTATKPFWRARTSRWPASPAFLNSLAFRCFISAIFSSAGNTRSALAGRARCGIGGVGLVRVAALPEYSVPKSTCWPLIAGRESTTSPVFEALKRADEIEAFTAGGRAGLKQLGAELDGLQRTSPWGFSRLGFSSAAITFGRAGR